MRAFISRRCFFVASSTFNVQTTQISEWCKGPEGCWENRLTSLDSLCSGFRWHLPGSSTCSWMSGCARAASGRPTPAGMSLCPICRPGWLRDQVLQIERQIFVCTRIIFDVRKLLADIFRQNSWPWFGRAPFVI